MHTGDDLSILDGYIKPIEKEIEMNKFEKEIDEMDIEDTEELSKQ